AGAHPRAVRRAWLARRTAVGARRPREPEAPAMSRVAVVAEADRFVRWTDKAEIHRDKLLHRSIHIMIMDSDGRMVIQRRHPEKLTWPDSWDIAVSGHVEE